MARDEPWPERLIAEARRGDEAARGRLLELYRNYLRLVARSLIGGALRIKLDPSDLVQETFLKAHRDFGQFAGGTERELVAWLRRILARSLANQVKHHRRQARPAAPGVAGFLLEQSDLTLQFALASHAPSPSEAASRREQAVLLADAVDRLPARLPRGLRPAYPGTRPVRGDRRAGWADRPAPCGCSGPGP